MAMGLFPPAPARGEGVVQLDENNGPDADPCVDDAENGSGSVETLRNRDAPADAGADFSRRVVLDEAGAGCVLPAPVENSSEDEDVEPVDEQSCAVGDELGEKAGGERDQRDGEEKGEVDPGEVASAFGDVIQLGLLTGPENAEGEKAHAVGDPLRTEGAESQQQFALAVNLRGGGNVQVEHQHRHGETKYAVAEGGQAFQAAALDAVVEIHHRCLSFLR